MLDRSDGRLRYCRNVVLPSLASVIVLGLGPFGLFAREAHSESNQVSASEPYRPPNCLAISPDGKTLYASDRTAGNVTILDTASQTKRGEVALHGKPHGVALAADGSTLYVAEHGAGSVAVIDTASRQVTSRIAVGQWPTDLVVADAFGRLYVCNQDSHMPVVTPLPF